MTRTPSAGPVRRPVLFFLLFLLFLPAVTSPARGVPARGPVAGPPEGTGAVPPPGPPAAIRTAPDSVFDVHRLADGVWAAVVRPDAPAHAFANSLVVVGDEAALIVDTQQSPVAARELVDAVARLTDAPVRWIVNTHRHGDHHNGTVAWVRAYPAATVVSHVATRDWIEAEGEASLRREREAVRRRLAEASAALEGSGPAEGASRRRLRRRVRLLERYTGVLDTLELVPADVTFRGEMEIDLGGRTVRLLDMGAAHSEADVVVQVPDAGVTAAGDLLEDGLPYVEDSDPAGWLRALVRLKRLETRAWLPGHGSVQRDRALLRGHLRTFRAVPGVRSVAGSSTDRDRAVETCRITWDQDLARCRRWVRALRRRAEAVRAGIRTDAAGR